MRAAVLVATSVLFVLVAVGDLCNNDYSKQTSTPHAPTHTCEVFITAPPAESTTFIEDCTDTPTPDATASVTPLANDINQWADKLSKDTTTIRKAHDDALSANADYASDAGKLSTFADDFRGDVGLPVSGIDGLSPPPAGLETQYDALRTAAHALTVVLANPVSAQTVDAAYDTYVAACASLQDYFDANNIDAALNCIGDIAALSPADFFAALFPIIDTMHKSADSAKSTFDALSPAQQADANAITLYGGGVGNAYGKAAQSIGILTPPAELVSLQQSFADAATAVFNQGQSTENDVKNASDPAALATLATSVEATFAPLEAAVETGCAQLEAAATSAGLTGNLGCRS